jgi:hypothetical protein
MSMQCPEALAAFLIVLFAPGLAVAQQPATPPSDDFSVSDELNQRLPNWLRFSGEERLRWEGFQGGGFKPDSSDYYLLNRLRLAVMVLPAPWLKVRFQTQDARAGWKNQKPYAAPFQDTWDLRLAYVELGDNEKRAGLRVGRQELAFGSERLVGMSNWSNTSRTFDAVRATVHSGHFRLDAFAASVVVLHDGQVGMHRTGNNLHGLYGGLEDLIPGSVIEPYFFWRLAPAGQTEIGSAGKLDSKTIGVRWKGMIRTIDYGIDIVGQTGSEGTNNIHARASHLVVGYTLDDNPLRPRFLAEYNYASGDHNPNDHTLGTFDELYPTVHDKYGLADQFGWQNMQHVRAGVELNARSKWMFSGKYNSFWLADAHDALYSSRNGPIVRSADGSAGRFVGQELDATALYALSKGMRCGAGFGYVLPGTFLKRTTPGKSYSSPYVMLDYAF